MLQKTPNAGVKPVWRTLALGLLASIGLFLCLNSRERDIAPDPFDIAQVVPVYELPLDPPDACFDHTIDLDFTSIPSSVAFHAIAQQCGINIVPIWQELSTIGISADQPITLHVKQVPLRIALDLVVEGLSHSEKAGWADEDGVVVISTRERIRFNDNVVRVYDVLPVMQHFEHLDQELVRLKTSKNEEIVASLRNQHQAGEHSIEQERVEALEQVIKASLNPADWDNDGGGSISYWAGHLIVTQTKQNQQKIAALLQFLQRVP